MPAVRLSPARDHGPLGVLLFNLGGPDDLASVEPFLRNLFSDREIIELPFGPRAQPFLARLIAKLRAPAARRNYASIGGGSPQLRLTREQAAALAARLRRAGRSVEVAIAMRYWQPDTEAALAELERAGVRRIVTLPLYPHYSTATTGSSRRELERVLARPRWQGRFEVSGIDAWPEEPLYLDALADTVRRGLEGFPLHRREHVVILFSAHGLPQRFIERGDPYVAHTEATRRGVLVRLGVPNRQELGFQSRTGPVRWIGPGTGTVLRRLGREGVGEVLVVPISFVCDHIETLYELDQLFAGEARRAGIVDYRRSDALNRHPLFIEALGQLVERHLRERGGAAA
ncbi:MAG: ferrochelatase [Vicinamibacteria bacterium]